MTNIEDDTKCMETGTRYQRGDRPARRRGQEHPAPLKKNIISEQENEGAISKKGWLLIKKLTARWISDARRTFSAVLFNVQEKKPFTV
jgi:hypothetical protein